MGVDKDSGSPKPFKATPANIHDVTMMSELLTGKEEVYVLWRQRFMLGAEKREGDNGKESFRKNDKVKIKIISHTTNQTKAHFYEGMVEIGWVKG